MKDWRISLTAYIGAETLDEAVQEAKKLADKINVKVSTTVKVSTVDDMQGEEIYTDPAA